MVAVDKDFFPPLSSNKILLTFRNFCETLTGFVLFLCFVSFGPFVQREVIDVPINVGTYFERCLVGFQKLRVL